MFVIACSGRSTGGEFARGEPNARGCHESGSAFGRYRIWAAAVLALSWLAATATQALGVGDEAPPFALPTAQGQTITLAQLRGQVVYVISGRRGARHADAPFPGGGDVRAIGPRPDGSPWRVGIRHPLRAGIAIAAVPLAAGALATSGDYERYFEIDGARCCHILNPATGKPVAHWRSVSVLAPLCVVAGSCATIAMLLEERAEAFLEDQRVGWLAVAADGSIRASDGNAPLHEEPDDAHGRGTLSDRTPTLAVGKPLPTR